MKATGTDVQITQGVSGLHVETDAVVHAAARVGFEHLQAGGRMVTAQQFRGNFPRGGFLAQVASRNIPRHSTERVPLVVIRMFGKKDAPGHKQPHAPADLRAAFPPPDWDIVLSLPANHATALVLVGYALHGFATPTSWPRAVAKQMPDAVLAEWGLLRPLLAHGTVWRDLVLLHLANDDDAHRDWTAFRAWTTSLTEDDMRALIIEGVRSGLRYYSEEMAPIDRVDECLARIGPEELNGVSLREPDLLRYAVEALAMSWGAPVAAIVEFASEPSRVK